MHTIIIFKGDGDTGSTTAKGAKNILEALNGGHVDLVHPCYLLQQMSSILQLKMGGTSGALYSIFLQSGSKAFLDGNGGHITLLHWCNALKFGISAIKEHALTEIGDRTMLDVLYKGHLELEASINQNDPLVVSIERFYVACESEAKATQFMMPKSGRAAYASSEKQDKTFNWPDPGAVVVSIWAKAIFKAINSRM
jgi:dihydroxyacetone kinase